jgi:hypothetical protein
MCFAFTVSMFQASAPRAVLARGHRAAPASTKPRNLCVADTEVNESEPARPGPNDACAAVGGPNVIYGILVAEKIENDRLVDSGPRAQI